MILSKKTFPYLLAPTILATSQMALTQEVSNTGSTAVLEEVIVTAQKREQSLQDVPVAVTAISGRVIEQLGIDRVEDLELLSPSLTIASGTKNTNGGVSIRGIGNNGVFGVQVEPAVLVVFDEVSQAQGGQAFTNIIDVERVEVLRGPQNTLFGKNASAGVVNIVTRAPSAELEGVIELTATDDDEVMVSGTVSGPIGDSVGYRLTGLYSDRDGWIENTNGGDDLNDREVTNLRGKLVWNPNDNWQVTVAGNYSEVEEHCCELVPIDYAADTAAFVLPVPLSILYAEMVPNISPHDESQQVARDNPATQDTENEGLSLKLDYGFNEFTLSSISAWNKWNNIAASDIDFSARNEPTDLLGLFSVRTNDHSDRESEFISQELRLLSPSYEKLDYLVGLFYSKTENTQKFDRYSDFIALASDTYQETETEGWALYGQANWRLGEATTLTTGLRYNDEEISADVTDFLADTRFAGDDSDDVWLGKLSLQHFAKEDMMLYASVSTGYKGQAFDTAGFDENKAENPVEAEESINYELGVKSTLLDGRMRLNAVLFHTQYDDFQAQDFTFVDQQLVTRLLNVGEMETTGVELEGTALVGDNLSLMFGVAWIDAEVTDWPNAPCYPLQTVEAGCNVELGDSGTFAQENAAGNKPANSPEWKFTLAGDYSRSLGELPFDGFINFSYVWQDEVYYDIKGSPEARQDSYGVANLSVGIVESSRERYRVTLFVNNLFDEFHSGSISDALAGQLYTDHFVARIPTRAEERYAGLRLKYAF